MGEPIKDKTSNFEVVYKSARKEVEEGKGDDDKESLGSYRSYHSDGDDIIAQVNDY